MFCVENVTNLALASVVGESRTPRDAESNQTNTSDYAACKYSGVTWGRQIPAQLSCMHSTVRSTPSATLGESVAVTGPRTCTNTILGRVVQFTLSQVMEERKKHKFVVK
eukprot:923550-Pleurochrysis_carterae.AAC.2